jgi:hypothetical protein
MASSAVEQGHGESMWNDINPGSLRELTIATRLITQMAGNCYCGLLSSLQLFPFN